MSKKPAILLVTSQSLLGECLVTALPQFRITVSEDIESKLGKCNSEYSTIILHLDQRHQLTPVEIKKLVKVVDGTRVIVFGKSIPESEVVNFLEAGAFDYRITESESISGFGQAIEDAVNGACSYGPERTRAIFERLQRLSAEVKRIKEIDNSVLTTREQEILREIESGKTNQEIAETLFLSLHTVKNHVHNMLSKLNCKNRREAVHLAHANGWLKVKAV